MPVSGPGDRPQQPAQICSQGTKRRISTRRVTPLAQSRSMRLLDSLHACSINIFNGMAELTFSCGGSHHLPWDECPSKG